MLLRRVQLSLAAATLWTWGLLGLRMIRDGWQPLEVWFSYGLSFLMTAIYVYFGLLIWATLRAERPTGTPTRNESRPAPPGLTRLGGPVMLVGYAGFVLAAGSIAAWLALRFPGPQAVPGTVASAVLALMVLSVAAVGTWIARSAARPPDQQ